LLILKIVALVRELAGGGVSATRKIDALVLYGSWQAAYSAARKIHALVLYGSWQAAYSATRLSSVAA
jgi:hypothetical protein